jgi:hypothetical protein
MATQGKGRKIDIESLAGEVEGQAKAACARGFAVIDEIGDMTRGNVGAVVDSGRILGAGLKEIGEGSLGRSRQAVDTFVADLKALAAIKSPADLFQFQLGLTRRNVDAAFALATSNGKALARLAGEAAAPISGQARANLARLRKAA